MVTRNTRTTDVWWFQVGRQWHVADWKATGKINSSQTHHMALEELEYSTWVIWSAFIVFPLCPFWTLIGINNMVGSKKKIYFWAKYSIKQKPESDLVCMGVQWHPPGHESAFEWDQTRFKALSSLWIQHWCNKVTSDCFIAQGLSRTVLDKCLMKERNEGLKWILGH